MIKNRCYFNDAWHRSFSHTPHLQVTDQAAGAILLFGTITLRFGLF